MTKLTISFPDNVAKRVCRLRNPDEFVRHAVEKALDREPEPSELSDAEASRERWRRIIQRVENESVSLGDYYPKFKEDLAEVRRDFRFKHDETE